MTLDGMSHMGFWSFTNEINLDNSRRLLIETNHDIAKIVLGGNLASAAISAVSLSTLREKCF